MLFSKIQKIFKNENGLCSELNMNSPVFNNFKNGKTNELSNNVMKQIGKQLGYTMKIVVIKDVKTELSKDNSTFPNLSSYNDLFIKDLEKLSRKVSKLKEEKKLKKTTSNKKVGVLTTSIIENEDSDLIKIDLDLGL